MWAPSRTQLVLLEIAAGAVLIGLAFKGAWLVAGAIVAAAAVELALVRWQRRWMYQLVRSWFGMLGRRRRLHGTGVGSLVGGYEVVTVPSGSRGQAMAAIRDETTWTVPLDLPLLDVLNADAVIPLDGLAELLAVEDVTLANVRLVTMTTPTVLPPAAPQPSGPVPSRLASRYLLLTLDTLQAADALAARGGSDPAVHQILRRVVARADEVLGLAGVVVRRMDERAVASFAAHCLGPITGGETATAAERVGRVELAGSASVTVAIEGPDALAGLDRLAILLPVPLVATAVLVRPGPGRRPEVLALLRMSGPADAVDAAAGAHLEAGAARLGLTVRRVQGEQLPLLRATTPLGAESERAA